MGLTRIRVMPIRSVLIAVAMLPVAARAGDTPGTPAPSAGAPSSNSSGGASAGGVAGTSTPAPEERIPFANRGGIYDWRVVDDRTVLIQGLSRQWFKATLMSSCIDLPFAQRIGFKSNPDGSFDKFSAITVHRQRCQLISLVKTDAPVKKSKSHAAVAKPAATSPPPASSSPTP